MIKELNKVIDKLVDMSLDGYISASYTNKLIDISFKIGEKLELEVREEGTYRLYYFDDIHAAPFEIVFKLSDIKDATYFEVGEFSRCPFISVIVLTFIDDSEIHCFEDVR